MMTTTTSSLSAAPAHDAPVRRGPGPVPGQRHAVVMGAGFGGIAAALRLRARGMKVTLVDRLDQLGGRARAFRRDGYTFDAGPTVITAPFLFDELFALFPELRSHPESYGATARPCLRRHEARLMRAAA